MNLDLPQLWAISPAHFARLTRIREALTHGARIDGAELEALLGFGENARARTLARQGKVAVISLRGVLTSMPLFNTRFGALPSFVSQLKEAMQRPDVSKILIDVDSPGGSTDQVTETHALVREARKRKRVVASVNSMAASAAYWIASAANEINITPSGHAGSLGVLLHHIDVSESMRQQGIAPTVFAAPEGKRDARRLAPLSREGRRAHQDVVDDMYRTMVRDIAGGRGLSQKLVTASFGEDRIFTAKEALRVRMDDRIQSFDETLDRVSGVSRKPTGSPTAEAERVMYAMDFDLCINSTHGLISSP